MNLLIGLAIANAIAHIVSGKQLQAAGSPDAKGVFAFTAINVVIALTLILSPYVGLWLALIFPAIGLAGLLITKVLKGQGVAIDYVILVLDVAMIVIALGRLF